VDADAWRAGFATTLEVEGVAVRLETERDPLHVLKMGTYFDTCLSLQGGMNAGSTLTNALDVNKHVVHGRPDGASSAASSSPPPRTASSPAIAPTPARVATIFGRRSTRSWLASPALVASV
jgi:hypothetical protein